MTEVTLMQQLHGFSVDVEDWFQVANLSSSVSVSSWDSRELRVRRNVEVLLNLLDKHGAKGTFFMLGWIARRTPEIIRDIIAGGHEIACHGEDHQSLHRADPQALRKSLQDLKALLDDATGIETIGYRAPNFSIRMENWWALDVLTEVGFRYDSSIFPFKRASYGVAGAPLRPYRLLLDNDRQLCELPPTVLKIGSRALPVGGGGYFRFFPYAFTKWSLRRIAKEDQPVFFYMHPWEVDPDQPRVKDIPFRKRFMHYVNLRKTQPRLERLLSDFKFTRYRDFCNDVKATILPGDIK